MTMNILLRFQDMNRRDVEILAGGAGIDLEQKVKYTGHLEDDGKLVSNRIYICICIYICYPGDLLGPAKLWRG